MERNKQLHGLMTKEDALESLRSLHDAAWKAFDEIPPQYHQPFKGSVQDEPDRSADVLYGRGIALGTAIQIVEQL